MKTKTLFFVILFLDIYRQRPISTWYIIDNRLLHNSKKSIVRNCRDFMSGKVFNSILNVIKKMSKRRIKLYINKKKQKLTKITTDTRVEAPSEQINTYTSILNNPKLEILILKGKPKYCACLRICQK